MPTQAARSQRRTQRKHPHETIARLFPRTLGQKQRALRRFLNEAPPTDKSRNLKPAAMEAFRIIVEGDQSKSLTDISALADLSLLASKNFQGMTLLKAARTYGDEKTHAELKVLIENFYLTPASEDSTEPRLLIQDKKTHNSKILFDWILELPELLIEHVEQAVLQLTLDDFTLVDCHDSMLQKFARLRATTTPTDPTMQRIASALQKRLSFLIDNLEEGQELPDNNTRLHYLTALGVHHHIEDRAYVAMDDETKTATLRAHPTFLRDADLAALNQANENGYTPLHIAVQFNQEEAARELLARQANLSCMLYKREYPDTPLSYAVRLRKTNLARIILAEEIDGDDDGLNETRFARLQQGLACAIELGLPDETDMIARKLGDDIVLSAAYEIDEEQIHLPPILYAAYLGNAQAYAALLALDPMVMPYLESNDHDNALDIAIEKGRPEIARINLEAQAAATFMNEELSSPHNKKLMRNLVEALGYERYDIALLIFEKAQAPLMAVLNETVAAGELIGPKNLFECIYFGIEIKPASAEQVDQLEEMFNAFKAALKTKLDELTPEDASYPHYYQCYQHANHLSLFHHLVAPDMPKVTTIINELADEFNPQQVDQNGNPLLHFAIEQHIEPETINLLLTAGASVDTRNPQGDTPLLFLIKQMRLLPLAPSEESANYALEKAKAVIRLLVLAGVDVDAENNDGEFVDDLLEHDTELADVATELRQAIVTAEQEKRVLERITRKKRDASEGAFKLSSHHARAIGATDEQTTNENQRNGGLATPPKAKRTRFDP